MPTKTMASEPLTIGFDVEFDEAIAAAVARGVVLPEIYYQELKGIARQLSFSIAGHASMDELQAVKDSLDKAMGEGLSFGEWKVLAAAMDLGLPEYRLENIFRTNLQGNYMRGKAQQFHENKDNRPYLLYDSINDSRTRPAHLAMDGTIRAVDDQFWATHFPPNGFRSILPDQRVSGHAILGLKARYSGPAVEIIGKSGGRFSVTAQHPVLTGRGWVSSNDIRIGDKLVSYSGEVSGRTPSTDLDKNNFPPTIEQVFDTLGAHIRTTVPRASVDLYGDVKFIEGDVDIVGTDRRLMGNIKAECAKFRQQFRLAFPNEKVTHRSGYSPSVRVFPSSAFLGGGGCFDGPLGYLSPAMDFIPLPLGGKQNTFFTKEFADAFCVNVHGFFNLFDGHAGLVHFNDTFWNFLSKIRAGLSNSFYSSQPCRFLVSSGDPVLFDVFIKSVVANPLHLGAFHNARTGQVQLFDVFWNWLSSFLEDMSNQFSSTDFSGFRFGSFDSGIVDYFIGSPVTHTDTLGTIMDRHAGLIKFDEVFDIRWFDYSGHVFDLETKSGLILAYGGDCVHHYVLSNCRCSVISLNADQAKSRSGQGTGLNKVPMVKGADGMFYPAMPDKGWNYNPYMEMQKIEVTPDHIVPRTPETRVDYDALAKKEFNRRLARWAKFLNSDESAMRETMRANAQGVADRSEVYLRANRESLGRMLKSGAADSHTGEIATKEWQGWADLYQEKFVDYALNAKSNPPIIGYLSESDDLAMGNYSLDKSGDIAIKLKSSVKVRTTAMYSDTTAVISDSSPVVIPRPLDDMDEGTIHLYAYGKSQRPDSIADTANQVNFWQAHVFDGVRTSDIDTILFSVEPPKVLQNQLKKAGIDWRIGSRIETELDDIIEF